MTSHKQEVNSLSKEEAGVTLKLTLEGEEDSGQRRRQRGDEGDEEEEERNLQPRWPSHDLWPGNKPEIQTVKGGGGVYTDL